MRTAAKTLVGILLVLRAVLAALVAAPILFGPFEIDLTGRRELLQGCLAAAALPNRRAERLRRRRIARSVNSTKRIASFFSTSVRLTAVMTHWEYPSELGTGRFRGLCTSAGSHSSVGSALLSPMRCSQTRDRCSACAGVSPMIRQRFSAERQRTRVERAADWSSSPSNGPEPGFAVGFYHQVPAVGAESPLPSGNGLENRCPRKARFQTLTILSGSSSDSRPLSVRTPDRVASILTSWALHLLAQVVDVAQEQIGPPFRTSMVKKQPPPGTRKRR